MGNSDLFKIVDTPVAPGICRTCGVAYGARKLIDTSLDSDFCNREHVEGGIDINSGGAVYFCESCVVNMAMLVGCKGPLEADRLTTEYQRAQYETAALKERILGMEKIINGYRAVGLGNNPEFGVIIPMDAEKADTDKASEELSKTPDDGDSMAEAETVGSGGRNTEIDELAHIKVYAGLQSIADGEPSEEDDDGINL